MKTFVACVEVACWDNDNDALIPELWAFETLEVVASNMVMGRLVHRDFEDRVQKFGDFVNCSRPNDFSGKRKSKSDSVTIQDAVSPNIQVPLNQHIHVSFKIQDEDLSKAFPDLIELYLEPAARECAETADRILCGQVANLLAQGAVSVGALQLMTKTNAPDYVLDANTQLDLNRAGKAGRSLVLGPRAQKACLGADLFVSTEKRGDAGTALRTASLGSVYGMDAYMDQNVNYRSLAAADYATGTLDGAEVAGATVIETNLSHAAVVAGDYVTIGGRPYRVASSADGGGDTANLTLTSGLEVAAGSGDPIVHYKSGAVDLVAGYVSGWTKEVVIDGFAANTNPTVGTILTFGTGASSHSYTVIAATAVSTTESSVLLDRPLDAAIANEDPVFFYPSGGVNLAFTRGAIAFVSRPLATVPAGTGASSFVASLDDLSVRVSMGYNITEQAMVVTFDFLCGVAILDTRLATVLLS